ncbi:MAG TPA: glycosyl hydrolase family 39, partial [Terriglobia bacterium]|nr:glycosyl hydrolase family 39 [Terriglobia bacterium]
IDVAGESQLVGYPTQFPSVSMVDWKTGQPNARYWVLKLLHGNFGPGDQLVSTRVTTPNVFAQAFVTRDGQRKILLVNQRDRTVDISLPVTSGVREDYVDQTTAFQPPASMALPGEVLELRGLAVAVVTLAK